MHPFNLSGYTVSVKKLDVLLVLSSTSQRATQPFAHKQLLNDVIMQDEVNFGQDRGVEPDHLHLKLKFCHFSSCVTLGEWHNLSGPQFPYLETRDSNRISLIGYVMRMK